MPNALRSTANSAKKKQKSHRKQQNPTRDDYQCVNSYFTDLWWLFHQWVVACRGGVKDTRLEAKAKDPKKIRGQGQGQPFRGQNLSRPRTGMLEAKAKDRGQRRKCSPKKKGFQKYCSGDLQFIGVPRIFDFKRLKPQITWNDVIKSFPKKKYLRDKDIVGWKIWNRCLLARNQDFAKEEGLN